MYALLKPKTTKKKYANNCYRFADVRLRTAFLCRLNFPARREALSIAKSAPTPIVVAVHMIVIVNAKPLLKPNVVFSTAETQAVFARDIALAEEIRGRIDAAASASPGMCVKSPR
jgi:hypothetical protein